MSADGRTDMVDQKAFIAETVFDEISNILCIFDAVAVADENDVILVTPATFCVLALWRAESDVPHHPHGEVVLN